MIWSWWLYVFDTKKGYYFFAVLKSKVQPK
jgi:hypothetical protein